MLPQMMQYMAVRVEDIKGFYPNPNQTFFLDNNIWMFLLCPIGNSSSAKQKSYSSFIEKAKSNGASIVVSSLVLSEFTNRYYRLDFELWKNEFNRFDATYKKDYVGSSRYSETTEAVAASVRGIMKMAMPWADNLNSMNIPRLLGNLSVCDFNDSYYAELVADQKWILVSDDSDFAKIQNLTFRQLRSF